MVRIKEVVEEKFKWSPDQRMAIWYGTGYNTIPLISESEIAELFDRCSNTKIVRFCVTIEKKQQHKEQDPVMAEDMDDQPIHAPFFAYNLWIFLSWLEVFLFFSSFPLCLLSLTHIHETSITRYAQGQAIALYDISNDATL